MVKQEIKIGLENGLQARIASQFVQKANNFQSDIYLERNGIRVNAKSIMGIMGLALPFCATVAILAEGTDEEEAVQQLCAFMQT